MLSHNDSLQAYSIYENDRVISHERGLYFSFEGRIWDLIVSVPDHCLSFYFLYFIAGDITF